MKVCNGSRTRMEMRNGSRARIEDSEVRNENRARIEVGNGIFFAGSSSYAYTNVRATLARIVYFYCVLYVRIYKITSCIMHTRMYCSMKFT